MHFSAIFVHCSLGGVLIQRRDEFEDEHKPQVWSGRTPCYDKDGNVKVVSLMRGFKRNSITLTRYIYKAKLAY